MEILPSKCASHLEEEKSNYLKVGPKMYLAHLNQKSTGPSIL